MTRWMASTLVALVLAATPALAADWAPWAELETIEVITAGDDGGSVETTIWIVVIEGTAYIRTSESSPWGDAVEGAATIGLRGSDELRTVRPRAITDAAQRESVSAAFRQKYGFFDGVIGLVRGKARIWSVEAVSS